MNICTGYYKLTKGKSQRLHQNLENAKKMTDFGRYVLTNWNMVELWPTSIGQFTLVSQSQSINFEPK